MNERDFFQWFQTGWLVLAVAAFLCLFFVTAPYGKFTRQGFGPSIDRRLGWIIMESPAVWTMVILFAVSDRTAEPSCICFLALWLLHYLNRTYVFPLRMRGDVRQMTALTALLGVVFNLGNGYLNGRALFALEPVREASWLLQPRFIVGVALFLSGWAINLHSDAILRRLRGPGETSYKIPQGGMFRFVTQANYFGELVEWTGWAIATWSSAGLAFLIWTAANLVPRAVAQHRWYCERFPDYPKERRAIIPFLL